MSTYDKIPTDNTENLPTKFVEEEKKVFQERTTQRQKDIAAAARLAALRLEKDEYDNPNNWWNRLQNMSKEEIELLPEGFIKKYGSFVTNLQRYDREFHMEENKSIKDYFKQIKHLKKLLTDEEKELMRKEFERAYEPDVVTMKDLER